jgi:hypothetical protein
MAATQKTKQSPDQKANETPKLFIDFGDAISTRINTPPIMSTDIISREPYRVVKSRFHEKTLQANKSPDKIL